MANGGLITDYLAVAVGPPSAYTFPGGSTGVPSLGANATETARYLNTTNNHEYAWTGSAWVDTTAAGSASLTNATAQLSSNVTMTSANTFYDGPTVSLAAGTWLITATVTQQWASAGTMTIKIWDGTTVGASAGGSNGNSDVTMSCSCIVTIGSTATWKVSAASSGAGNIIRAAATTNGAGNNATTITAVKIG